MSELVIRMKASDLTQSIHVNRTKRHVKIDCIGIHFTDKDSKQVVVYMPALEISGYGETLEKAESMLYFAVDQLCRWLVNLSAKDMARELSRLGWKHDSVRNKVYSKAYVDIDGGLQGFNADSNSVQLKKYETA